MTLDWQVVLIALVAVFLRIITMRPDPETVTASDRRSHERSTAFSATKE